jgi:hypothetical protein
MIISKRSIYNMSTLWINTGLVRQPGWLSHKSRKMRRILSVLYGICSITEVIEQAYYLTFNYDKSGIALL